MARPNEQEPRNLDEILEELIDRLETAAEEAEEAQMEKELAETQAQYDEAAVNLRMMYDSFVEVGFTEKQSFYLLLTLIGGAK